MNLITFYNGMTDLKKLDLASSSTVMRAMGVGQCGSGAVSISYSIQPGASAAPCPNRVLPASITQCSWYTVALNL